jgi:hypothetical protein
MKMSLFLLLTIATLSPRLFRVRKITGNSPDTLCCAAVSCIRIDSFQPGSCKTAYFGSHYGTNGALVAFLFLRNSILCVAIKDRKLQVLKWNGSGCQLILLEIGGSSNA